MQIAKVNRAPPTRRGFRHVLQFVQMPIQYSTVLKIKGPAEKTCLHRRLLSANHRQSKPGAFFLADEQRAIPLNVEVTAHVALESMPRVRAELSARTPRAERRRPH